MRLLPLVLISLLTGLPVAARSQDESPGRGQIRGWIQQKIAARWQSQEEKEQSKASPLDRCPELSNHGTHVVRLEHGGLTRTALVYVPAGYASLRPSPVVLMFHGGIGTAENASTHYGWREKADEKDFIAVFPQGTGRTWNAIHGCGSAFAQQVDDVGFVRALITGLEAHLSIDPRRIFATGMSNGAMFSHRLGAEMPDILAAIAPVEGSVGGSHDGQPHRLLASKKPVAVLIIHGRKDQNVLYDGGTPIKGIEKGRTDLSVADAVAFWVTNNRCQTTPERRESSDGKIITTWYRGGVGGRDVELVTVVDGGHSWPGGKKVNWLVEKFSDAPCMDLDATDTIWTFFNAHPRPAGETPPR